LFKVNNRIVTKKEPAVSPITPKAIGVDLSVCYKNLIFLRWFCDSFELTWIMEFGLAGI